MYKATYQVELTGLTPLLMHRDNIEFGDDLKIWREDPDNRKASVAGDDRSPAFTWIGSVYADEGKVVIPSANIMRCIMEGGALVPVPGGRGGKTFKAQTQSGIFSPEMGWPVIVRGAPIDAAPIFMLHSERDFKMHVEAVKKLGFSLFTKRVKIGNNKHVRVRPKFSDWAVRGTLEVSDEQITSDALLSILRSAGEFKGLCDWRPSSRTPGPYGRFRVALKEIKSK